MPPSRQRARIRADDRAGAHSSFGGATIDVLAPLPDYLPVDTPKNNDSLVLRVRYGRHAFLLCGDVERQIEWGMLDAGESPRADVLKVAHHGSRTSSTEEFLVRRRADIRDRLSGVREQLRTSEPGRSRPSGAASRRDLADRPRRPDHHPLGRPPPRRRNVQRLSRRALASRSVAVHHTRAFCRTVRSCRQPMRFRAANTRRALAEGQELMPRCRKRYSRNRPATHRERSCREQSRARPIVRAQSRPVWNRRKEAHSLVVLRRSIGHLLLGWRRKWTLRCLPQPHIAVIPQPSRVRPP